VRLPYTPRWCGGKGNSGGNEPNPPQAQTIGGDLILSDKNHFKWE
jgi:hypothetical protein